jgi:hypothetical protein
MWRSSPKVLSKEKKYFWRQIRSVLEHFKPRVTNFWATDFWTVAPNLSNSTVVVLPHIYVNMY